MSIINLAQKAVEKFIKDKKEITPPQNLDERFKTEKAGVFVTLKNNEKLRGCVGTIKPTKNSIAEEVISSAIAACKDPRLPKIKPEELPDLEYEINILKNPKLVVESNSKKIPEEIKKINPKKEGIIVESENKKALLLPGLPGLERPKKQIKAALKKGGIKPYENYKIYKFETEKHERM